MNGLAPKTNGLVSDGHHTCALDDQHPVYLQRPISGHWICGLHVAKTAFLWWSGLRALSLNLPGLIIVSSSAGSDGFIR